MSETPTLPVSSHWTLISVKRNGNPQSRIMFSKTHTELEMELLARKNPGVYSHFVVIETREECRPTIHVFEQENPPNAI
jgi:hypothetical protein